MNTALTPKVAIWDLPIRLFHWLLVGLMAFSWWSGEEHELELHRASGYAILGLIVFRLIWGFAGTRTARFSTFVKGPSAVAAYAGSLARRGGKASGGHNPLGGWSVIAMLLAIAAMVTAGLFAVDVDGWESGPLADYISFDQGRTAAEIHETIFNIILVLVAFHIAAILFYRVWKGQNLIGPMVTGKGEAEAANSRAPVWKFALTAAVAAAAAYAVSKGFRF